MSAASLRIVAAVGSSDRVSAILSSRALSVLAQIASNCLRVASLALPDAVSHSRAWARTVSAGTAFRVPNAMTSGLLFSAADAPAATTADMTQAASQERRNT